MENTVARLGADKSREAWCGIQPAYVTQLNGLGGADCGQAQAGLISTHFNTTRVLPLTGIGDINARSKNKRCANLVAKALLGHGR